MAGMAVSRGTAGLAGLLGPAFVASMAYVDPGNVAANLSAGARYSYRLVWVLVAASAMAMLVQYLSAKLGVVTGRSLSTLVSERFDTLPGGWLWRRLYALQALAVAVATDVAELIGGALALYLLFGVPLWLGGLLVGLATLVLLQVLRSRGEHLFQAAVCAVLGLVVVGFVAGLFWAQPSPQATVAGLRPGFPEPAAVPLAAAMLGATVMPHAIYLHSTLAADRHRPGGRLERPVPALLRAQRVDVLLALLVAGGVNVSMLLFAAAALPHSGAPDTIEQGYRAIHDQVGFAPATVFALGLLASGLGSSVVGTHAGARMMRDLLPWQLPSWLRRTVVIAPATLLLWWGGDPTRLLVVSQLALSFGIAFALVPLLLLTGSRAVMGEYRDHPVLRVAAWTVVALVVVLNGWLLVG